MAFTKIFLFLSSLFQNFSSKMNNQQKKWSNVVLLREGENKNFNLCSTFFYICTQESKEDFLLKLLLISSKNSFLQSKANLFGSQVFKDKPKNLMRLLFLLLCWKMQIQDLEFSSWIFWDRTFLSLYIWEILKTSQRFPMTLSLMNSFYGF